MPHWAKQFHNIPRTLVYSQLVEKCFIWKSLNLTKAVHAHLIKVGVNKHTFLGNRCLQLYTHFQCIEDILNVFDDINTKNNISWNICLKGLMNNGHIEMVNSFFQRMPERDVVSWNSMISWHASCDRIDIAWEIYRQMVYVGKKPSGHTYSILLSVVSDARHGKELHGSLIRNGLMWSSVVLGNSLICMYGKLGIIDYAFGVFLIMEHLDVISWNSLIGGCCRAGYGDLALNQFSLMRSSGYSPDKYTCSLVISSCTDMQNLAKGEQVFSFCIKAGFFCNSIISGAIINLFSKCNKLDCSIKLFKEVDNWDSAVCNSMISSYSCHGLGDNALQILLLTLRENIRPTEVTISSVLASLCGLSMEQGAQIHSLVVKLGFDMEGVVASSLLHMYGRLGLIDNASKIFSDMHVRDLICWNTMIMCLTQNGKFVEAVDTFKKLERSGLPPDRISLTGVLSACSYGGFVDEGITIFSKIEKRYGIEPCYEHYSNLIDLLCRAKRFNKVMEISRRMPYAYVSTVWKSLLDSCIVHGDVTLAQTIAKRLVELEPHLSLPYLVLSRIYEMKNQWEDLVRVRETMNKNTSKKVEQCSWMRIRDRVYTFGEDDFHYHEYKEIYSILALLCGEVDEAVCVELM